MVNKDRGEDLNPKTKKKSQKYPKGGTSGRQKGVDTIRASIGILGSERRIVRLGRGPAIVEGIHKIRPGVWSR